MLDLEIWLFDMVFCNLGYHSDPGKSHSSKYSCIMAGVGELSKSFEICMMM